MCDVLSVSSCGIGTFLRAGCSWGSPGDAAGIALLAASRWSCRSPALSLSLRFSAHPDKPPLAFSLAVPRLDPPGLRQEPLPGPGGAAGLAGPAAGGGQGSLLAPLPRSNLPPSVPSRCLRCWQQMDEQIKQPAAPGQALALELGKFLFPFAKHLQGLVARAGIHRHQQGDSAPRAPRQLPAPVEGWQVLLCPIPPFPMDYSRFSTLRAAASPVPVAL